MKTINILISGFILGIIFAAFVSLIDKRNQEIITEQAPIILQVEPEDNWDLFVEALAWIESRHDSLAVGRTNDVGWLQITPVIIADANRILGYKAYNLKDRVNKTKSLKYLR